jgi:hypothetical protein
MTQQPTMPTAPLATLSSPPSHATRRERAHGTLHLQQVPEPKAGKNWMHLDIVADEIEPEITRLEALGARRLHDGVLCHTVDAAYIMRDADTR